MTQQQTTRGLGELQGLWTASLALGAPQPSAIAHQYSGKAPHRHSNPLTCSWGMRMGHSPDANVSSPPVSRAQGGPGGRSPQPSLAQGGGQGVALLPQALPPSPRGNCTLPLPCPDAYSLHPGACRRSGGLPPPTAWWSTPAKLLPS